MSYGRYDQHSPYYQEPSGQYGQPQYSDPSRGSYPTSSSAYQPLSAYQNVTAPSINHSTNTQNQPHGANGDPGRHENNRALNSQSVDAQSLGSLAYASSMDQYRQPLGQQNHSYQPNHQSYGTQAGQNTSGGQQWQPSQADRTAQPTSTIGYQAPPNFGQASNPPVTTGLQTGRSSPAGYNYSKPAIQTPSWSQNQEYAARPPQQQASQYQPPQQAYTNPPQQYQQQRQSPQLHQQRPQSNGNVGHQVPPPPSKPVSNHQVNRSQGHTVPPPIHRQSPQLAKPNTAPAVPKPPVPQQQAPAIKTTPNPGQNVTRPAQHSPAVRPGPLPQPTQSGSNHLPNQSPKAPPLQEERPTTIDPAKIFNESQYQRQTQERRLSLASDGRNGTKDVPTAKPGPETEEAPAASEASIKDQMELEMKQMLDRMREYKAKDPSLFSEIWEQVKKGQAAAPASPVVPVTAVTPSPTIAIQQQAVRPSESLAELEIDQSPFPAGFDRGRFPYQRRRRGPSTKVVAAHPTTQEKSKTPAPPALYAPAPALAPPPPQMPPQGSDVEIEDKVRNAMNEFRKSFEKDQATASPLPVSQRSNHLAPGPGPGPPKIGNTIWPEQKKAALAEAASKIINSQFSRDSRVIMPSEFIQMLDLNPSYTQLCEYLEAKGFVLERAQFARALLRDVPDIGATGETSAENTPVPASTSSKAPPQSSHVPPPVPAFQQPRDQKTIGNVPSGNAPHFHRPAPVAVMNTVPSNTAMPAPSPEPLTKQDKARKRNFSEIIDLSQMDSDEEDGRYNPVPRVALSHSEASAPVSMPPPAGIAVGPRVSQRDHIRAEVVAQPMNKRRDALRRSTYDPRTICRDVLVSSGKHPSMAPLNQHLDIIRERFKAVDFETDLSTLRWDLLDPGGEPPPDSRKTAAPQSRPQPSPKGSQLVKQPEKTTSKASVHTTSTPTVKVQVGIPSKRPPEARKGNVASSSVSSKSHPSPSPGTDQKSQIGKFAFVSNGPAKSQPKVAAPAPSTSSPARKARKAANTATPTLTPPKPRNVPGRIGRPPGAKNKFPRPDKGISKKQSSQTSVSIIIPSRSPSVIGNGDIPLMTGASPSKPAHRPTGIFAPYKCLWEGCPAELHDLETCHKHVRKHRTRLEAPYPCRWAGCGEGTPSSRAVDLRRDKDQGRFKFTKPTGWDLHVEAHVRDLATK